MATAELWNLHQQVVTKLAWKITEEKARLEARLRAIELITGRSRYDRVRRTYPPVLPKYQNPNKATQTWSGRGKTPLWLKAQLGAGKRLEDFVIVQSTTRELARIA